MTWNRLQAESSVVDAILTVLVEAGVEHVVGMPGGMTLPIWGALHRYPSIRPVLVREESIGSYLAEAYGRLSGVPLVVMGQGEWIVGNAGQAFMEALLGSSPMVVLTEMSDGGAFSHQGPYQGGSGDYGSWDARSALGAVTKRVLVSQHPVQAVQMTQLAFKHAGTGAPGPVAVIYSSASLRGTVGPASLPAIYPTRAYLARPARGIDPETLGLAAEMLGSAKAPVLLAGNGVRLGRAWDELAMLADALDAPVATTPSGKGVFPERHELAAGVIGPFGSGGANSIVAGADVILAVGTKLSSSDIADGNPDLIDPQRQELIQIDIEPVNTSWTLPVSHVLVAEAATALRALTEKVTTNGAAAIARRTAASQRVHTAAREHGGPQAVQGATSVPLHPRAAIEGINSAVPDDTIVTCDAGENRLFMMQWYRSGGAGRYLQPAAGGGMGYAVPAALGARLAHPQAPVLAVCGDGGFSMGLHALITAVEESLPIAVVVLNNRALGWVLHGSRKPVAAELSAVDHVQIARALGCDGVGVSDLSQLGEVLRGIATLSRPLVIDVPVSLEVSFRDVLQPVGHRRKETGY